MSKGLGEGSQMGEKGSYRNVLERKACCLWSRHGGERFSPPSGHGNTGRDNMADRPALPPVSMRDKQASVLSDTLRVACVKTRYFWLMSNVLRIHERSSDELSGRNEGENHISSFINSSHCIQLHMINIRHLLWTRNIRHSLWILKQTTFVVDWGTYDTRCGLGAYNTRGGLGNNDTRCGLGSCDTRCGLGTYGTCCGLGTYDTRCGLGVCRGRREKLEVKTKQKRTSRVSVFNFFFPPQFQISSTDFVDNYFPQKLPCILKTPLIFTSVIRYPPSPLPSIPATLHLCYPPSRMEQKSSSNSSTAKVGSDTTPSTSVGAGSVL
ncbi:hypothetical protein BaRGS_00031239 [Batillaria attramentaria]|uniref:Uncharacterized protein n=1 Tax=Batillaria attramentaria TaxID=370345 RepID=A0ABD0JSB8_9CAEN